MGTINEYFFQVAHQRRYVVIDVPLVPKEVAELQNILDFCEEREPGQGQYVIGFQVEFEWRHMSNSRTRTISGLTIGEQHALAVRWCEHPENECRFWSMRPDGTRIYEGKTELFRHAVKPDKMDRDMLLKHGQLGGAR
jgi:hypothetical protein